MAVGEVKLQRDAAGRRRRRRRRPSSAGAAVVFAAAVALVLTAGEVGETSHVVHPLHRDKHRNKTQPLFSGFSVFSSVCPEPVLAK